MCIVACSCPVLTLLPADSSFSPSTDLSTGNVAITRVQTGVVPWLGSDGDVMSGERGMGYPMSEPWRKSGGEAAS